jgi:cytochrome c biogenesis factor
MTASRQTKTPRTPLPALTVFPALSALFKPLASLRLTIVCLACAMFIVFVGTLDQVQIGVYEAQLRYFKSFFLYFSLPGSEFRIPYFPGGYTLGAVLLVNLIAAHLARFKFSWKKSGIMILHSGLILLLIGQLVTSVFEEESQIFREPLFRRASHYRSIQVGLG